MPIIARTEHASIELCPIPSAWPLRSPPSSGGHTPSPRTTLTSGPQFFAGCSSGSVVSQALRIWGQRPSQKISKSGPFCVNRWDRLRSEQQSGSGPEQALEAIKASPRAQRESFILSRASLRAQDRSRGALPKSVPQKTLPIGGPVAGHLKTCNSGPFCVNRWDRPRDQRIGVPSARTLH